MRILPRAALIKAAKICILIAKGARTQSLFGRDKGENMKKIICITMLLILAITAMFAVNVTVAEEDGPSVTAFSAYMTDAESGRVLYAKDEDKRHEIASMVKIMTANLVFEALDRGDISLDQEVTVSQTAAGMGGSQMFLDAGSTYKVDDLIKGVIVASANDASVALAELISGSHEGFVNKMNERAREMGMNNTLFSCATGLPDSGEQYSTARDVNIMTRALMSHKKYYDYASIWREDFVHPGGRTTQLVNTNKLIRNYAGCVGGKTGFTNEAGFCLSACADRKGVRVVATLIGGKDSKTRFAEVSGMFNYAFANYSRAKIAAAGEQMGMLAVRGGRVNEIPYGVEADMSMLLKTGEEISAPEITLPDKIKAPVARGDVIGTAKYTSPAGESITVNLIALESAEPATFWDYIKKIVG